MSGGGEPVKINPGEVEQTAQGVAGALAQAAEPGPVPTATGASPIDGAALAAAGTVIAYVSAASADLAPRGAEVTSAADSALAGLQTADTKNATTLSGVGQQSVIEQLPARPGAATASGAASPSAAVRLASSGLGGVEQAVSSVTSAIGSPASSLGGMSPTGLLSGAPVSSLAGTHKLPHDAATTPENLEEANKEM
jgi:hypothetical protein